MTEKDLINTCKKLVEDKLQLPQAGAWRERDFQFLSDHLFEKTGTRLSISTLKRIWKGPGKHTPQLYTLSALAQLLGFENWNDFKGAQLPQGSPVPLVESPSEKTRNFKKVFWITSGILILLISLLFISLQRERPLFDAANILFKSRKSISSGVPNTVVFEYDITKTKVDSAIIQQSWNPRMRAKVSRNNRFQTFIYYYPGFHTARLIIGDSVVKRERISISTDGWEAIVSEDTSSVPYYIDKSRVFPEGKMYVFPGLVPGNSNSTNKKFSVHYFNVGQFNGIESENFTLETRIKNNLQEGALVCQYVQVSVICENGMISLPFCHPGCVATAHLHVSDILKRGKENDLTPFGVDLSGWKDIIIKAANKEVTIAIDKKNVYTLRYNEPLGKVAGLHYHFYGFGAVDDVKLYNSNHQLSYSNDFTGANR